MLLETNQELSPFVILALHSGRIETDKAILKAFGFKFKPLHCSFSGVESNVYLVPFDGPRKLQDIITLAKKYRQDMIQIVDSERQSELYYINDDYKEKLGKFKQVMPGLAMLKTLYFIDPSTDLYWCSL